MWMLILLHTDLELAFTNYFSFHLCGFFDNPHSFLVFFLTGNYLQPIRGLIHLWMESQTTHKQMQHVKCRYDRVQYCESSRTLVHLNSHTNLLSMALCYQSTGTYKTWTSLIIIISLSNEQQNTWTWIILDVFQKHENGNERKI